MASGCLIIASDTAPVREVIRDKENGLLVDFFKPDEITERVLSVLAQPERVQGLRRGAYSGARGYALDKGIAEYMEILSVNKQREFV